MAFIPVNLNIKNKRILVVGGGKVALHKLRTITRFTRTITIVAPKILDEIARLRLRVIRKAYSKNYLKGVFLVYACTNDRAVNKRIRRDAHSYGILVNVADDTKLCDFISPAVYKKGAMVVSVSSEGRDVKGAVALRDRIKRYCDEHTRIRNRS